MARKRPQRLTPLESLVMNSIWDASQASVRSVQETLRSAKPMARTTVLTVMRRLRDKGFLTSERQGRTDIYKPVAGRKEAAQLSLRDLLDRFFAGSATALVSQLLESDNLDPEEVRELQSEMDGWLRDRSHARGQTDE